MSDVDYVVVVNDKTGTDHLIIKNLNGDAESSTVCGLLVSSHELKLKTTKVKDFWRTVWRCKNCARAAKR